MHKTPPCASDVQKREIKTRLATRSCGKFAEPAPDLEAKGSDAVRDRRLFATLMARAFPPVCCDLIAEVCRVRFRKLLSADLPIYDAP